MGRKRSPGVRARSARSIEIDFTFRGVRCRERLKLKPIAANLRYAERFKGEIENAIERGTFDYATWFPSSRRARQFSRRPGAAVTVAQALREFLEAAQKRVAWSTYLGWRNDVERVLIPQFGDLVLADLRAAHVQDWIDGHELTQKRTCNVLTPLRQVMAEARAAELVERDPLADFKVKRRQADKLRRLERDDVDPFDVDEIRAILPELNDQARNYVLVAVWSGLRPEELIELKWDDVDLEKGIIRVRRARTRGRVKEPKTAAGRRDVKALRPALNALKAQRAHTAMLRGHVFHDPRTGAPYATDKQFREWQWRPALTRARVRYRPPHQLRHTYATWMLQAGEPIKWVSLQMGHESTKMTLDTYADWIPSMSPEAGALAERLWSQPGHKMAQAADSLPPDAGSIPAASTIPLPP